MKTILIPTDFSKNAENALHYAINLANKMQAKLILLHSFHIDYTNAYVSENIIEKEIEEAKTKSNTQLKALYNKISHHSKHPIECISSQDLLVDEILRLTEERHIDLIVMGTQGANHKLGRQIFGTNSSRVIEKANCPVITIPEWNLDADIKNIVYTTAFLDSDIICLQSVVNMAKLFDAKIQVINVSLYFEDKSDETLMEKFKQKVSKSIAYDNITYKTLIGNSVEQRIESYVEEEKNIDLLIMSAHHRNLMDKLFGKSITKVMAFYLNIPLMVFHHERNKLDDANDRTVAKLIL